LAAAADAFRLTLGNELVVHWQPTSFEPAQRTAAVAVYFGGAGGSNRSLEGVLDPKRVSVIPVASTETQVTEEVPAALHALNCCLGDRDGDERVTATVLESLGLLRRQRRVFLSYRRIEAREAAVQLFDELSARGYDVFLDTHSVARGVDFQESLWHRLSDVDVMVMLDTPGYFQSRWTSEEFGQALAKNIGVLRVQWPDMTPSVDTETCSRVELVADEVDPNTGALADDAIERIGDQLERFRSLTVAVRRLSAMSQLEAAVRSVQGQVVGVGPQFTMHVRLANGEEVTISSVVGVPDSQSMHEAIDRAHSQHAAVLYDHIGVMPRWNEHLSWLGANIRGAHWIRASHAAEDLQAWRSA
jgi:hypothetical protein